MAKHLIPLTTSAALCLAIFAACTIGDPDDPTSGDGDGDGGMGGSGDGTGGSSSGSGGNSMVITSCDEQNGGCDELCDEEGGQITCSCLPGAKLGADEKSCEPLAVLYLGDDGLNSEAIHDRLVVEGFEVVNAAPFFDWNGVTPSLAGIDVVVFLQGQDFEDQLSAAADQAVTEWMLAGGTVIRSEWSAYWVGLEGAASEIDDFLPIDSVVDDFDYNAEWFITDPVHPLTAGLENSWVNVNGGCTIVEPYADTVVIAESDLCGPMLSYHSFGQNGGKVIHINDDFGEDQSSDPDSNTLNVLVNAINYGGL